ncbi:hypothetical protein [Acidianus ambivalens]|uniref:Uncharacterized protein n=1 Tax=Acidianus ambivalens TaxID=2283 RepID=A0A650CWS2_ACIAM|nr:hypothetical protein [Acidianus ambivalens]MQL54255.1 hypothetical protein [Acidianus ambivalens]QGR22082.1 hypothetical protein D1866_08840 [Acidianus ambivalens]
MRTLLKIGLIFIILSFVVGGVGAFFILRTISSFFVTPTNVTVITISGDSNFTVHYVNNGSAICFYYVNTSCVKILGIPPSATKVENDINGKTVSRSFIFLPTEKEGNITIVNPNPFPVKVIYKLSYIPPSYANPLKSFLDLLLSSVVTFLVAGALLIVGLILIILGVVLKS